MRASLTILQIILSRGEGDDVGKDRGESGVMRHANVCVEIQCTGLPLKEVMYLKTPRMKNALTILNLAKNPPQTQTKILLYIYHVLVPTLGIRVTES